MHMRAPTASSQSPRLADSTAAARHQCLALTFERFWDPAHVRLPVAGTAAEPGAALTGAELTPREREAAVGIAQG
jgi:hypothetical protein